MIIDDVLSFYDHNNKYGIYVKTITKPLIHGFFDNRKKLEDALKGMEDKPLYFIRHRLLNVSDYPQNCFKSIPKGGSVKKEDISHIQYFVLDIDPKKPTGLIRDKREKRNLTKEENLKVIEDAKKIRNELLSNGFENIGLINSGNGAYLFFPFKGVRVDDKEKQKETEKTLRTFASMLKRRITLKDSIIDLNTVKLSQCFKVPGTISNKGEATEKNPYRHACIVEDWDPKISCWNAIKEYVEAYEDSELVYTDSHGTHLNVDKCIERFEEIFPVYFGGNNDYYVRVTRDEKFKDMLIDSTNFIQEIRIYLRKETEEKTFNDYYLKQIIEYMRDKAYQKPKSPVASRAYFDRNENVVYYDLCNERSAVKITTEEISVVDKPLGMFSTQKGDLEQVAYIPTQADELPELLKKITRLNQNNLIILSSFLCVCFLGNCFPTPICLITGPQGSSKSTLTRFIQRIVHPQTSGLLSLLEKKDDIAIALSKRLLTCFDNASGIKAEISDLLCTAVTKGVFQKRELYTTRDERLIEYVSIMVINGIDIISKRTDLMERCIMLEMESIDPNERKTEKELDAKFDEVLPQILGAIFDAIQKVLAMEDVELPSMTRMADFESWSVKFSIAMGFDAQKYQEALKENLAKLVDAVSFGNPVVYAVVESMKGKASFRESVEEYYRRCYDILTEKATSNEKGMFPKSASAFSRSLSGLGKNLKSFGITYTIKNIGPNKEIRIENDGSVISNTCEAEKAGKLAYEKEAAYIASEEKEE